MMDLLIKNGTIVTATESFVADLAVKDGKITAIGKDLDTDAKEIVDATGKLVLPGAIDAHTHMAMPFGGTVSADSYLAGTRAAACGRNHSWSGQFQAESAGERSLCGLCHALLYHKLK